MLDTKPDSIVHSVRRQPARPADGRGRHRRAARHLQAQRAVPARRPPRVLLRLHGCDGAEPLPADRGLSEGRARQGGLLRPPARGLPDARSSRSGRRRSALDVVGSVDAMQKAVDYIRKVGRSQARSASRWRSCRWMPAAALRDAFPDSEIMDALFVLERLRARQAPGRARDAADRLRARDRVHAGGDRQARAGHHQAELAEALRREETNRGLTFEYCLITAGTSHNRAPSDQRWEEGDMLSLDSGGNYRLYRRPRAAWRSWASPTPSWRTCWPRSRTSSAPP